MRRLTLVTVAATHNFYHRGGRLEGRGLPRATSGHEERLSLTLERESSQPAYYGLAHRSGYRLAFLPSALGHSRARSAEDSRWNSAFWATSVGRQFSCMHSAYSSDTRPASCHKVWIDRCQDPT